MKRNNRQWLWLMVLPMMAIGLYGFKGDRHNFQLSKNLDIFNSVLRELNLFYVDTLDVDKTVGKGIEAMLAELDPYTVYYPEDEDEDLKMMTTGKYAGVGAVIRFHKKYNHVVVVEPYVGMPAYEVGLKAGDILLSIDGEDLEGMPVGKVSEKLRGEPGSTLHIQAKRPGEEQLIDVKLARANIHMPAVPYYGLLSDDTGYILLNSFTEKCARDVRMAVIDLKNQGAQKMILDLRGNGGGSLSEAVDIVNLFVPKGVEVVYTKGKIKQACNSFKTKREPLDLTMPLVIMVDGQTASAAEIVSGALQDLDRALVVGRRTYGKGLVQVLRDLPYNGTLKVTTSKYYIPSGRCVQAIDYSHRAEDGSVGRIPDSLTTVFHTASGREVRDGGGVMPDVEVEAEKLPNLLFYLVNSEEMFDFATDYVHTHATIPPVEEFEITPEIYSAFKDSMCASGFTYDRQSEKALQAFKEVAEFEGYMEEAKDQVEALEKCLKHDLRRDLDNFEKEVKYLLADEIVKRYYYQRGGIIQALKGDEGLSKAQELLANPEKYEALLKPSRK